MTKTSAFIALSFALVAAVLMVMSSLIAPKKTMAAASESIDVYEIARGASMTMTSFDETYQRHMGILDTLKAQ